MPSLLDALGGRDAMEIVVVGLLERTRGEPRLATFFRDVARGRHEVGLVEYLCALFGDRPVAWTGRDLRLVHLDLAIRDADLDRFLDLFEQTLIAAGVSRALVALARARLESVRPAVVAAGARP